MSSIDRKVEAFSSGGWLSQAGEHPSGAKKYLLRYYSQESLGDAR